MNKIDQINAFIKPDYMLTKGFLTSRLSKTIPQKIIKKYASLFWEKFYSIELKSTSEIQFSPKLWDNVKFFLKGSGCIKQLLKLLSKDLSDKLKEEKFNIQIINKEQQKSDWDFGILIHPTLKEYPENYIQIYYKILTIIYDLYPYIQDSIDKHIQDNLAIYYEKKININTDVNLIYTNDHILKIKQEINSGTFTILDISYSLSKYEKNENNVFYENDDKDTLNNRLNYIAKKFIYSIKSSADSYIKHTLNRKIPIFDLYRIMVNYQVTIKYKYTDENKQIINNTVNYSFPAELIDISIGKNINITEFNTYNINSMLPCIHLDRTDKLIKYNQKIPYPVMGLDLIIKDLLKTIEEGGEPKRNKRIKRLKLLLQLKCIQEDYQIYNDKTIIDDKTCKDISNTTGIKLLDWGDCIFNGQNITKKQIIENNDFFSEFKPHIYMIKKSHLCYLLNKFHNINLLFKNKLKDRVSKLCKRIIFLTIDNIYNYPHIINQNTTNIPTNIVDILFCRDFIYDYNLKDFLIDIKNSITLQLRTLLINIKPDLHHFSDLTLVGDSAYMEWYYYISNKYIIPIINTNNFFTLKTPNDSFHYDFTLNTSYTIKDLKQTDYYKNLFKILASLQITLPSINPLYKLLKHNDISPNDLDKNFNLKYIASSDIEKFITVSNDYLFITESVSGNTLKIRVNVIIAMGNKKLYKASHILEIDIICGVNKSDLQLQQTQLLNNINVLSINELLSDSYKAIINRQNINYPLWSKNINRIQFICSISDISATEELKLNKDKLTFCKKITEEFSLEIKVRSEENTYLYEYITKEYKNSNDSFFNLRYKFEENKLQELIKYQHADTLLLPINYILYKTTTINNNIITDFYTMDEKTANFYKNDSNIIQKFSINKPIKLLYLTPKTRLLLYQIIKEIPTEFKYTLNSPNGSINLHFKTLGDIMHFMYGDNLNIRNSITIVDSFFFKNICELNKDFSGWITPMIGNFQYELNLCDTIIQHLEKIDTNFKKLL